MLSRLALECIVKEEDTSDLDDLDGLCRKDKFLESGDAGLHSGENAEGDNSGAVSDSFDADDGKGSIYLGYSPPKRPQTAKRLVNSIDAAIDEDNRGCGNFEGKAWTCEGQEGKDHLLDKQAPGHQGRQRQCDILQEKAGLRTIKAKFANHFMMHLASLALPQ